MKTLFTALLLALLAACTALPGRESDVEAVLAASGLDAQLRWLRQPLAPDQTHGPLALVPDEWIAIVNATVAETLQPADIRGSLQEALRRNLSARELAEVQRFYESATGRHVVAAESGRLEAAAALPADAATLEALADATGLGKAVSQLAERGLGEAIDIVVRSDCLGQGRPRFAGLLGGVMKKAQLLALRNAVNARMRQRYASLSPEERTAYLDFIRSRAGQKFLTTRNDILNGSAQRAGAALGSALTPRVKELCQSSV